MTQGLTFDQAILVEGEHTGRLVQTARGKAFPIAAPGNCVHFFGVRYFVFRAIAQILIVKINLKQK